MPARTVENAPIGSRDIRRAPRPPEPPMPLRRFIQCDVFSPIPTQGNGLAVVVDAEGLSDDAMQRFAAWTNLAETTFLLPPTDPLADYRVRIFTPMREMPFAGHPTLGSCASWLHAGGVPRQPGLVRQQCGVGIVPVRIEPGGRFAFDAPPTTVRPMDPGTRAAIVEALAIPPEAIVRCAELQNGPVWQAFELASAQAVMAADASRVRWPTFRSIGLIGPRPAGDACDWEVRMLAPSSGMSEDPITGSLNAAIARWRRAEGRLEAATTVAQGTTIGRSGRVSIAPDGDAVWIGGQVHVLVEGTLRL
jgi:PhzF family phenazine biosynthesis protein